MEIHDEQRTCTIGCRIEPSLRAEIEGEAAEREEGISATVRELLREALGWPEDER
jgi:hypothetical protein